MPLADVPQTIKEWLNGRNVQSMFQYYKLGREAANEAIRMSKKVEVSIAFDRAIATGESLEIDCTGYNALLVSTELAIRAFSKGGVDPSVDLTLRGNSKSGLNPMTDFTFQGFSQGADAPSTDITAGTDNAFKIAVDGAATPEEVSVRIQPMNL